MVLGARDVQLHRGARGELRRTRTEFYRVRLSFLHDEVRDFELGIPRDGAAFFDGQTQHAVRFLQVGNGSSALQVPRQFRGFGGFGRLRAVKTRVWYKIRLERVRAAVPRFAEFFGRAVLFDEPGVPLLLKLGRVGRADVRHIAPEPVRDQTVFVVDLDHADARVLQVAHLRVRVHVRKELFGVLFLQGDHARLVIIDPFVELRPFFLRAETVRLEEFARNVEVNIHVHAVEFELVNEPVKPVEFFRVQRRDVREVFAPDLPIIHVVEPDRVDAEAGDPLRVADGLVLLGEIHRGAEVHAPEADLLAVPGSDEAVAVHDDLAVGAGDFLLGRIRPNVGDVFAHREKGEKTKRVFLGLNESREEKKRKQKEEVLRVSHGFQWGEMEGLKKKGRKTAALDGTAAKRKPVISRCAGPGRGSPTRNSRRSRALPGL